MRGYLVKRGHLRGNWLRRYVVLEGHILRWYDKPGGKVKGQINIAHAEVNEPPEARYKRSNVLDVYGPAGGEHLIVQADGAAERAAWRDALLSAASAALFMQGTLSQPSSWRKSWKPRFFVLAGTRLSWFDSEIAASAPGGRSTPKGVLHLLAPTTKKGATSTTILTGAEAMAAAAASGTKGAAVSPSEASQLLVLLISGSSKRASKGGEGVSGGAATAAPMYKDSLILLAPSAALATQWARALERAVREEAVLEGGSGEGAGGTKGGDVGEGEQGDGDERGDSDSSGDSGSLDPDGGFSDDTDTDTETEEEKGPVSAAASKKVAATLAGVAALSASASIVTAAGVLPIPSPSSVASVVPLASPVATVAAAQREVGAAAAVAAADAAAIATANAVAAASAAAAAAAEAVAAASSVPKVAAPVPLATPAAALPASASTVASMMASTSLPSSVTDASAEERRQKAELEALLAMDDNESLPSAAAAAGARPASQAHSFATPTSHVAGSNSSLVRASTPSGISSESVRELSSSSAFSSISAASGGAAFSAAGESGGPHRFIRASGVVEEATLLKPSELIKKGGINSLFAARSSPATTTLHVGVGPDDREAVREEINAQRVVQRHRQSFEGGGDGERGDRRWGDEEGDDRDALEAGRVREAASLYGSGGGETAEDYRKGKRWQRPEVGGSSAVGSRARSLKKGGATGGSSVDTSDVEHDAAAAARTLAAAEAEKAAALAAATAKAEADALASKRAAAEAAAAERAAEAAAAMQAAADEAAAVRAAAEAAAVSRAAAAAASAAAAAVVAASLPWASPPESAERNAMRRRVYDFLLRRSAAAGDAAAASYLADTVVPAVETALYETAGGNRAAYLDGTTLKARLKVIFAQQRTASTNAAAAAAAAAAAEAEKVAAAAVAEKAAAEEARAAAAASAAVSSSGQQQLQLQEDPGSTVSDAPPSTPGSKRRAAWLSAGTGGVGAQASLSPPDSPVIGSSPQARVSIASPSAGSADVLSGRGGRARLTSGNDEVASTPRFSQSASASSQRRVVETPQERPLPVGEPRWGNAPHPGTSAPLRHYPAQLGDTGGGLHIALVLDKRPEEVPNLPDLNKWQHRQCADCGTTQSTGMWGTKAFYCSYTELLFCGSCMSPPPGLPNDPPGVPYSRSLPWRIVHLLDDTPQPVCRAAAEYIDTIWDLPVVALTAIAPRTLSRCPPLQRLAALRARLVDLRERIARAAVASSSGSGGSPMAAAKGNEPGSEPTMLSELAAPAAGMAARSPAAAAALVAASTILRRALGARLSFLGEVPELLPPSLIVPLAEANSPLMKRVTDRLGDAATRLQDLAIRIESGGGVLDGRATPDAGEDTPVVAATRGVRK